MPSTLLLLLLTTAIGDTLPPSDSPRIALPLVTVSTAFPPAAGATATLSYPALQRLAGYSLADAANTVPGVRMEERSPGSYRFSIRGSLLRSPFGVRNVKVYIDDVPLTDAGGGTYLQLIDVQSIGRMQILKGPAGSLYGAGTGGAVLLHTPAPTAEPWSLRAGLTGGAYGRLQGFASAQYGRPGGRIRHALQYSHTQSDGFRAQSRLRREGLSYAASTTLRERHELTAQVFLADLAYGTPGGLTLAEMEADPRQARPPTATLPGAVQQNAAVRNRTGQLAVKWQAPLGTRWSGQAAAFGRATGFVNPTIRNYETRDEANAGARLATRWHTTNATRGWNSDLTLGAEGTAGRSLIRTYANTDGMRDAAQADDRLALRHAFLFAQEQLTLRERWVATAGASVNLLDYDFRRRWPDVETARRALAPVVSPRVQLQYRLPRHGQLYAVASHGFSAPTLDELRPSTGAFNPTLAPEAGWNLEAGANLHTRDERLRLDVSAFRFDLRRAIVLRRAPDGAEYFENAGGTRQQGLETSVRWKPAQALAVGLNHTWSHFRFAGYRRADQDFSGNQLTGVPAHALAATLDYTPARGVFAHAVAAHTGRLPLDDANAVYAPAYTVLSVRAGWKWPGAELFAGGDNLLNTRYSAGHDLNAAGGRYYNPAAGRTWFAGVIMVAVGSPQSED